MSMLERPHSRSPFVSAAFFLFVLVFLPAFALGQEPDVPRLDRYATDLTGTLSSQELSALNARLKAYEDTTSTQIVVLMIQSTGQEPIERYALRVAETNLIGQKGRDNGALLLVAKDDRELRIETGYGLEGALPDALSSLIIFLFIMFTFLRGMFGRRRFGRSYRGWGGIPPVIGGWGGGGFSGGGGSGGFSGGGGSFGGGGASGSW